VTWTGFVDGLVKLLTAITALLWPILVGIVVWKLLPHVREVLKSRNFSIEVAGLKIGAQDFSDQVRTQIEDLQNKVAELRASAQPVNKSDDSFVKSADNPPLTSVQQGPLPSAQTHATVSVPRILWVDDNPPNNAFQIARLRESGVEVVEALSTSEAMNLLTTAKQPFAAVISDMGRREEGRYRPKAGMRLIETIRNTDLPPVPIFIYSSPTHLERTRAEATAAGATAATASPVELLEMLRSVLKREV
jgi:CheY-like chemotaxis protein